MDLALVKNTKITERLNLQLRADAFDVLNHPNYGQPGASGGFLAASLQPLVPVASNPATNNPGNQFTTFPLSAARASQPATPDHPASCSSR